MQVPPLCPQNGLRPSDDLLIAHRTYEFIAALPPPARQRGLPKDMVVLPGERVRVSTTVRSDFELAADGRIAKQIEAVVDGYDIPATISRYEFLTARRLADPPPVWYWKVCLCTRVARTIAQGISQFSGVFRLIENPWGLSLFGAVLSCRGQGHCTSCLPPFSCIVWPPQVHG